MIWLFALLMTGGGTAVLLRLVSHPTLLDKATKTEFVLSPVDGGNLPYQWLSMQEILVFDTLKNSPNRHEIALYRMDVFTGTKTRLTKLERCLTSNSSLPYSSHISSDGKRLLIFKGSTYQVVDLDGSGSRKWQDKNGVEVEDSYSRTHTFWLKDSRHVVQILASEVERAHSLLIQDVDMPTVAQRVPLPDTPELDAQDYFSAPHMTPSGVLFAYAPAFEENDTRTLLLVRAAPPPSKTKTALHAPPGTTFVTAPERCGEVLTISPDGTRVAWLCKTAPYASPLRTWLHRFLPHVKEDPISTLRLYISPVDGSQMREIGGIEMWDTVRKISDLRWLPGGKRLSFILNNTLYTVSAEE